MRKLLFVILGLVIFCQDAFCQKTDGELYTKSTEIGTKTYQAKLMESMLDSLIKSKASLLKFNASDFDISGTGAITLDYTNGPQQKLVSGTNIKTINGNSLLGSGDLTVGGGGGISGLTADFFPYATSATAIANSALKYVSDAQGLRVGTRLFTIPGINSGSAPFQIYNHGMMTGQTDGDRLALPKGIVNVNWSMALANNWQWDEADQRAEPYDTDFPMIAQELGGEGVISHYTAPGSIPATAFHEINRFGGSVEGLSGIDPLTVHIPFNQFKATIYAAYSSTTTPPVATNEAWWGGSNNIIDGRLNPLLWLRSDEQKGTLGTFNDNEYFRLENTGPASAYPAMYFGKSTGSFGVKTAALTNQIVGKIGSNAYDGSSWQNTGTIDFVTRGTISSGNAAQSFRVRLSATNTAAITTQQEWFTDNITWFTNPYRFNHTSISTVPSYSAVFTPTNATSTIGQTQALSASTGGMAIFGLTTTSASGSAVALSLSGILGSTAPAAPAVIISGRKHNGTTGLADLAATEIALQIRNNGTAIIETLGSGRTGFGVTTPTANIHIKASTTAASTAQIKLAEGSRQTSAEDGTINYVSNNIEFVETSTVYTLAKTVTGTATLNFDLTSVNSEDLTITVTGAADGDAVSLAVPSGSATANVFFTAWVSASNTVTVRAARIDVASGADPASGTFRASVIHY